MAPLEGRAKNPFDSEVQDKHPTKYSDCHALGMVIYEDLGLRTPFYLHRSFINPGKAAGGDHPERPEGAGGVWFADDVWGVLEDCWVSEPRDRLSTENVLRCLEKSSMPWVPPSVWFYTT